MHTLSLTLLTLELPPRAPGVGKTWLSSMVCAHGAAGLGPPTSSSLAMPLPGTVCARHLVVYDNSDLRDTRRMICSLAFQLARWLPGLSTHVRAALSGTTLTQKNAVALFECLISAPLWSLDAELVAAGAPLPKALVMVIDGLDEVAPEELSPLLSVVVRDFAKTPPWIGLMITSRADATMERRLKSLKPLPLGIDSEDVQRDVRAGLATSPHALVLLSAGYGPAPHRTAPHSTAPHCSDLTAVTSPQENLQTWCT